MSRTYLIRVLSSQGRPLEYSYPVSEDRELLMSILVHASPEVKSSLHIPGCVEMGDF